MVPACALAPYALKTPSKLRFAFGIFSKTCFYSIWEPLELSFLGATAGPLYWMIYSIRRTTAINRKPVAAEAAAAAWPAWPAERQALLWYFIHSCRLPYGIRYFRYDSIYITFALLDLYGLVTRSGTWTGQSLTKLLRLYDPSYPFYM